MFKALLKMEGKEYNVLQCNYEMDREVDQSGRPSTDVRGGTLSVVVESSQDTRFFDWMIDGYAQKDGEVEFYKRNDPSPAKVLKFEEAYMVRCGEAFDITGEDKSQPMVEKFTVSARKITLGGTLEKVWPE
jgi:hypothetical protein